MRLEDVSASIDMNSYMKSYFIMSEDGQVAGAEDAKDILSCSVLSLMSDRKSRELDGFTAKLDAGRKVHISFCPSSDRKRPFLVPYFDCQSVSSIQRELTFRVENRNGSFRDGLPLAVVPTSRMLTDILPMDKSRGF